MRAGSTRSSTTLVSWRSPAARPGPPTVEKIFWYDFRDDTSPGAPYDRPAYNDTNHDFHYGLLRRSFPLDPNNPALRKPAFLAYRALTNELAGLTLQEVPANGLRGD